MRHRQYWYRHLLAHGIGRGDKHHAIAPLEYKGKRDHTPLEYSRGAHLLF